jgi:dihydrodipicolinate synthase/N-acetylneuraminate lyase
MMSSMLEGIFAPITTPYQASGDVDLAAAGANCRQMIDAGLTGIVVAGSTGEAPLLEDGERAALLGAVRRAVPEVPVLMGIGAESTRQTIARARAAADGGATAALCVAPHYFGAGAMTDAALRAHYRAVADASPVPVVLYTIPKYMHFALSQGLVAELAQHENIIGIKDSSGDPALLATYLASQSDAFTVLTGNGAQFLAALRAGARGGILAVCAYAPALSIAVRTAFLAGNEAAAAAAQEQLTPLATEIVAKLGIGGVKAAYDAVGLTGGPVRGPLVGLDAAGVARVRELLTAAGIGVV